MSIPYPEATERAHSGDPTVKYLLRINDSFQLKPEMRVEHRLAGPEQPLIAGVADARPERHAEPDHPFSGGMENGYLRPEMNYPSERNILRKAPGVAGGRRRRRTPSLNSGFRFSGKAESRETKGTIVAKQKRAKEVIATPEEKPAPALPPSPPPRIRPPKLPKFSEGC